MDRLVEARQNRQENKPRPYRQFRKPFVQNRRESGEVTQDKLRNKPKPAEELNTEELMSHMRCELVDIEEAMDILQPQCRGVQICLTRKAIQPGTIPRITRTPRRGVCD